MLEKACITVENTAKGGGVYPEVLFQVAKYWYELYLRVSFQIITKFKSKTTKYQLKLCKILYPYIYFAANPWWRTR